jgi:anti-sigma B factor antagonist
VDLVVERDGDILIIQIRSTRVAVEMGESFEQQIAEAIEGIERPRVLVDFGGVEFISSAILGKLIKLSGRVVTDSRGELKLSSLADRIAEVFKITGLEKLFSIHKDRAEALAALK